MAAATISGAKGKEKCRWGEDRDRLADAGLGQPGERGVVQGGVVPGSPRPEAGQAPQPAPPHRGWLRAGRGCHSLTWLVT